MVNEAQEGSTQRRWQLDIRSIQAGIAHIRQTSELSDVTIFVGSKKFKGHSLILMARSEKFRNMFYKEDGNRTNMEDIRINNVGEQAFEILFNYIYTNKIGELVPGDLVLEVHRAATIYGQQGLSKACETIIEKWEIFPNTVISMLQMSDMQFVKDRCWEYLRMNAMEVLASDGILEASSDTMCEIFERGYFNGIPVMDLLTHVIRWAAHLFPHPPDYEQVREHLLVPEGVQQRCLMSWIGFQKLSLEQLGVVVNTYPRLINDSEFRMFFQYLTASEDRRPALPSWVEG